MKLKTEQEIERLSVAHANMVSDASFPEWHGREASFRRGYTQAQQDLVNSASGGFEYAWKNPENNDWIYEELAAEVKETCARIWQTCSLSNAKKMQEKDAEIERLKTKCESLKDNLMLMLASYGDNTRTERLIKESLTVIKGQQD